MDLNIIQPLFFMCIVTAVTPGPNNFIVLAVSTREGKLNAIPPYLGICLGFPLMVFLVSFLSVKIGHNILDEMYFVKYIGASFLLYLSIKIFFLSTENENANTSSVSFLQAFFSNGLILKHGLWC